MSSTSESRQSWSELLEGIDPVLWLSKNTGFNPYPHQAQFLNANSVPTRVVRKARQVGMTTTLSEESIWKAYTTKKRVILFVSPSFRQSKVPMSMIQETIDLHPELAARVVQKNVSTVSLTNGSVIISLPNSPGLIRGFTATDVYLDEAAHFINDQKIMAPVRPMLLASHGSLTVVSTPFGKRGLFNDMYQKAVELKDLSTGTAFFDFFPSTINPTITEADVNRIAEEGNMTDLEIKQEFYGVFIEEVDVYYPMDLIQPCAVLEPFSEEDRRTLKGTKGKEYFWGIDVAKKQDETVIYILTWVGQKLRVVYVDWWAKIDYSDQAGRLGLLKKRFPPAKACIDATGVGEAVYEMVRDNVPNVEPIDFSSTVKERDTSTPMPFDLASRLHIMFEHEEIEIPNDRKLLMQLNGLVYTVSKTGKILFESPQKARLHDDHAWALALAAKAATMATGSILLGVR